MDVLCEWMGRAKDNSKPTEFLLLEEWEEQAWWWIEKEYWQIGFGGGTFGVPVRRSCLHPGEQLMSRTWLSKASSRMLVAVNLWRPKDMWLADLSGVDVCEKAQQKLRPGVKRLEKWTEKSKRDGERMSGEEEKQAELGSEIQWRKVPGLTLPEAAGIPLATEWPRGKLPFPCLLNLFSWVFRLHFWLCTTHMAGAGGGQKWTLGRLDWS